MSDSREAFEGHCARIGFVLKPDGGGDYLPGNGQELWSIWCASWQAARAGQAVSVPEETLTAIHDTLRLVWSRELSADDGLDEIEILIPPASADVPEGWKIVPIYSTTEMDNAAREANYQMFIDRDHADAVWTAMIAASPCVSQSAESEPPKQEEDQ